LRKRHSKFKAFNRKVATKAKHEVRTMVV